MAGRQCPKCGNLTMWQKGNELRCSRDECGYKLHIPSNLGKGGKGQRCPLCNRYTFFNGRCHNKSCGVHE